MYVNFCHVSIYPSVEFKFCFASHGNGASALLIRQLVLHCENLSRRYFLLMLTTRSTAHRNDDRALLLELCLLSVKFKYADIWLLYGAREFRVRCSNGIVLNLRILLVHFI